MFRFAYLAASCVSKHIGLIKAIEGCPRACACLGVYGSKRLRTLGYLRFRAKGGWTVEIMG